MILAALVGCATKPLNPRERDELGCLRELKNSVWEVFVAAQVGAEGENEWIKMCELLLDCEDVANGLDEGRFRYKSAAGKPAAICKGLVP